jgi:hypothetical protein
MERVGEGAGKDLSGDPERAGNYLQHSFDTHGVARVYKMRCGEGVWTLWGDEPDFSPLDFRQRFTGTLSADGTTITGTSEPFNQFSNGVPERLSVLHKAPVAVPGPCYGIAPALVPSDLGRAPEMASREGVGNPPALKNDSEPQPGVVGNGQRGRGPAVPRPRLTATAATIARGRRTAGRRRGAAPRRAVLVRTTASGAG